MRGLYAPSSISDAEKAERASNLSLLIRILLIIVTIALVAISFAQPALTPMTVGTFSEVAGLTVVVLILNRHNWTILASWLFVAVAIFIVTKNSLSAGGIRSPGVSMFYVFALASGLLLGLRAGVATALACAGIGFALVLSERYRFLPPETVRYSAFAYWWLNILYMGLVIFLLHLATRSIRRAFHRAESELAARSNAERRLQTLLDHTPFLLAHCDRDGRYVAASRSYSALFGLTPDEIIGKRVVDVVGARSSEMMRPHIEAVLAGKRVEYEAEIQVGDVEPRHYHVIAVPERNEQDQVLGYIVSVIDITERVSAFEENERLLEKLATEIGIGIWELDLHANQFVRMSGMAALYGLEAGTINSADFRRQVHADDRVDAAARRDAAIRERQTFQAEFRVNRPNGEIRWMLGVGRGVYDKMTGEPTRMVGLNVDITQKKANEEEAELQRRELTHLMRVATLGGLSGGIAHELGQPLASILANAQAAEAILSKDHPDLAEVLEILREIAQEDQRAGQVIRRLRQLLHRGEHQRAPVSLNELIASTLQLLHSELATRKIKVDTDLRTGLPLISGDSVELQQVLINLIMNAIEAMASIPPSERTLSIITEEKEAGNIAVSIKDRGPGMSRDKLERIFEPFFTTKLGGLGLGLSICSTIVMSHHGKLGLRNASEGGIVATVSLPKSAQVAAAS